MSRVAILEREDVALFINAACACTGQTEFYGAGAEQRLSLDFLHAYVFGNYRRLYGLCLVAGINHYNQARIIETLLRAGVPRDVERKREEGRLIAGGLAALPPQRVYRLFGRLRSARVNNRRSRAVLREWLAGRDLAFDAVKYRGLLRSAVRHAHLRLDPELHDFLFDGPAARGSWTRPLLDARRRAQYEQRAIFELPFSVAEGLAATHGIPRQRFLERIAPKMTRAERERTLRIRRDEGEESIAEMSLLRGCTSLLVRPIAKRDQAWRVGLRAVARRHRGGLGRVRAVLDDSYSSRGGSRKRHRPLAVALGVHLLLDASARDYRAHWTSGASDPFAVRPRGQTALADGLLDALEDAPDLLVVVSDGFENDPPGAAGEVLRLFRRHLDPDGKTMIVHLNPVFDAESFMPRPLGPAVPTVGLRDPVELFDKLAFARFALGELPLSALESWLVERGRGLGWI